MGIENPFNKLDAVPIKDNPDIQKDNFDKNFQAMLKAVDRQLNGLTPRQTERARKIFNECLDSGLIPDSPENSETIIGKIISDLENPESSADIKITGGGSDEAENPPAVSSVGKLFDR